MLPVYDKPQHLPRTPSSYLRKSKQQNTYLHEQSSSRLWIISLKISINRKVLEPNLYCFTRCVSKQESTMPYVLSIIIQHSATLLFSLFIHLHTTCLHFQVQWITGKSLIRSLHFQCKIPFITKRNPNPQLNATLFATILSKLSIAPQPSLKLVN